MSILLSPLLSGGEREKKGEVVAPSYFYSLVTIKKKELGKEKKKKGEKE